MSYGVDTTRPVELRPNGPDKRTQWAILKSDGFLHVITASVYRYDNEYETAGTIYVHIGCSTMIKDTVRDGEGEWDAIRRVVTTWQQEQRDADHAEALAMVEALEVTAARRALNIFPLDRELTDRETAMVEAYRRGEMIKAPSMAISPRFDREDYPMRGHAGRPSDRVTHFSRLINGNRFDFSRIIWGDGGTTFRVHDGGTMNVLHEWNV